jgi:murein peptide amidase A
MAGTCSSCGSAALIRALAVGVVAWSGLATAGCQEGQRHPRGAGLGRQVAIHREVLRNSPEGRPIECLSVGSGEDVVLVLAAIHGSEPAGKPLVECLAEHLSQNGRLLEGRKAILVPVANPDGLARGTRANSRSVDVNRNFPAPNFQAADRHGAMPLSEPESRAILDILMDSRPSRIVSIHQPLVCVDYDGPAGDLARAMAATTDLPVKKLGGLPGSLGSYAGETLGIPIVTLELPRSADTLCGCELWQEYGEALLTAIEFGTEGE